MGNRSRRLSPRTCARDRLVEDGVGFTVALPPIGRPPGVADLLRIEIGALVADRLEVEPHRDERALRDDGRDEAVERLLGAAVGLIDEVRQRAHPGGGDAGEVADVEAAVLGKPLVGNADETSNAVTL
jgi:hypothetical protein